MNIYSKMISKTFAKCTSGKSISFQGYPDSLMLYLKGLSSLVGPDLTTSLVTGDPLLYDDGTVYVGPSFTGGSEGIGVWPEIADGLTQVSTASTVGGNGYSIEMSLGMVAFFASQDSGTIEFSVKMGVASADITEDQSLFTVTDTVTGGLYRSAGGVLNFAGASYTVPGGWEAGEAIKIQIKKESGMVSVGVGDVFGTAVTFVPFDIVEYLRFGFLTTAQFGRGDLKLYNQQDSIWTEVLVNGDFTDVDTGWVFEQVYDGTNGEFIENSYLNVVSDGTYVEVWQDGVFELGTRYKITVDVKEISGAIKITDNTEDGLDYRISSAGIHTVYVTGWTSSTLSVCRSTACNALVDSISVKEESTSYV